MSLKKVSVFTIAVLSVLLGITVVKAYVVEDFEFYRVGQYEETDEHLGYGTKKMFVSYSNSKVDATLGLSLSYKGLFGKYYLVSRCNLSTYGNNGVTCTWADQSEDDYRGTLIFNSSNDGKSLAGEFYIRNI